MHRAVPLPQNHPRLPQPLRIKSAIQHVGIPHHHFVQRNPEVVSGIAPEVLIGKEENFLIGSTLPVWRGHSCPRGSAKSPAKRTRRIRRSTNHPTPLAAKRLDRRRRIHIRNRRHPIARVIGHARAHQILPAVFYLSNLGHIGHRTSSVEIRKYRHLPRLRQNISALRHKMHTAKNDVFATGMPRLLRKFVGVAAKIGEANDFIALIVVS